MSFFSESTELTREHVGFEEEGASVAVRGLPGCSWAGQVTVVSTSHFGLTV